MDFLLSPDVSSSLLPEAFAHLGPPACDTRTGVGPLHPSDLSLSCPQGAFLAVSNPLTEAFVINGAITDSLIIDVCVPHQAVSLAEMVSVYSLVFS